MKLLSRSLKVLAFVTCWSFCVSYAQAQEVVKDTTAEGAEIVVEPDTVPSIPIELVRERLKRLEKTIPLTYNEFTHDFVEFFAFRKPSFTKTMLEKRSVYLPLFEEYLRKYNLPDELKYLSMIESGLNPKAISYAKAGGLWQFMPRTATLDFGLRMDQYVDERLDPIKSTEAACRYMTQLYRIFGDWELVLAAYNTGPGNVKRAQKRSGRTGFWEIYNHLHKQTRGYVPQYVGMVYMMQHAHEHDIFPEAQEAAFEFDTLHVNSYLNLEKFAQQSLVPMETIQRLNPHILTNVLPGFTRNFALRVPKESYDFIASNRQMIMDSATKMPVYNTGVMLASNGTKHTVDTTSGEATASNEVEADEEVVHSKPKKLMYKIKKGEGLFSVAQRFNVEVDDLKIWNHLRGSNIQAGQKLVIYQEQASTGAEEFAKAARKENSKNTKPKYVKVQRGDTLWSISQRYGGVSVDKIKKLNRIRGNSLKAGQRIRIS